MSFFFHVYLNTLTKAKVSTSIHIKITLKSHSFISCKHELAIQEFGQINGSVPLYILLLVINFMLCKQKYYTLNIYCKLKYMKICFHFSSESQQQNIQQDITGLPLQFIKQTLFRGFPSGHLCLDPFQSLGYRCQLTFPQWKLPVHEI